MEPLTFQLQGAGIAGLHSMVKECRLPCCYECCSLSCTTQQQQGLPLRPCMLSWPVLQLAKALSAPHAGIAAVAPPWPANPAQSIAALSSLHHAKDHSTLNPAHRRCNCSTHMHFAKLNRGLPSPHGHCWHPHMDRQPEPLSKSREAVQRHIPYKTRQTRPQPPAPAAPWPRSQSLHKPAACRKASTACRNGPQPPQSPPRPSRLQETA